MFPASVAASASRAAFIASRCLLPGFPFRLRAQRSTPSAETPFLARFRWRCLPPVCLSFAPVVCSVRSRVFLLLAAPSQQRLVHVPALRLVRPRAAVGSRVGGVEVLEPVSLLVCFGDGLAVAVDVCDALGVRVRRGSSTRGAGRCARRASRPRRRSIPRCRGTRRPRAPARHPAPSGRWDRR